MNPWFRGKTNVFEEKGLTQRTRTHILCDDILIMILTTMSAEDVWRLQSVCQQFSDCVEEVLKSVRAVEMVDRNGFNSTGAQIGVYDISKSLFKGINSQSSRNNLESVADKCPLIRKVYVDHRVSPFTLSVFIDHLEALNEIHLGPTFLSQTPLNCQLISDKMRQKVQTMSLWYKLSSHYRWSTSQNQRNRTIVLVSNLPNLKSLFISQYRQWFANIWDLLPLDMNEVSVENYYYESNEGLEDIHSQSLHKYLNRCGRGPQTIWSNIAYNVRDLTLIALKCELKRFCLNCRLISIQNLMAFLESTHTLMTLCVIRLYVNETNVMPKQKIFPSIRALTLRDVWIYHRNVENFLQCFPEVEELVLIDCLFVCNCPHMGSHIIMGYNQNRKCKACGAEGLSALSSLQHLKHLTLGHMIAQLASLDGFNAIQCIQMFLSSSDPSAHTWSESMAQKEVKYKQFIEVCKQYCNRNQTKRLEIQVLDNHFVDKQSLFGEIPQNLKLLFKKLVIY